MAFDRVARFAGLASLILLPLIFVVLAVVILSPLARRLPVWIRFSIGIIAASYLMYDGYHASTTGLRILGVGIGGVILVASIVDLWRDLK
jgi:hypothetical protein